MRMSASLLIFAEAHQCRARIYYKQGDLSRAKHDLDRAKQLETRQATAPPHGPSR
jgi:hypothetical protein